MNKNKNFLISFIQFAIITIIMTMSRAFCRSAPSADGSDPTTDRQMGRPSADGSAQ